MVFEITLSHDTITKSMKAFSESLYARIASNPALCDEELKSLYKKCVVDVLNNLFKKKPSRTKKPSFPVPFYGEIIDDWCKGVRKNHRLYTQCTNKPNNNEDYCHVCSKQAANNSDSLPNCGNIYHRKELWSENLYYKPDGMKKEIPYANIIDKLQISWSAAENEASELGWGHIPDCHKTIRKARRGRPAKTKVAVSDSEDEQPKRKRGRPKKDKKKVMSDEELIAALCGEI